MKFRKTKLFRTTVVLIVLILGFSAYVVIVNRNTSSMTARQKILKAVYPLWVGLAKALGKNAKVYTNQTHTQPVHSIYDLKILLNNGDTLPISNFKGKKMLLVNTASNCGYTPQYDDLEKLYKDYNQNLIIIGFPANDFKHQEQGNDQEIAEFCKLNFGVSFPLAKKSSVKKGENQNEIFRWLSSRNENGWNEQSPTWNFSKYLIDENGTLTNYFDPSVSPLSDEVVNAINNK